MTKNEFRELLTRYMADSGILLLADPGMLRPQAVVDAEIDKFRDKFADKLYKKFQKAVEDASFDSRAEGLGGLMV